MSKDTCSAPDCAKDARALGLCWQHYSKQRRANMPAPNPQLKKDKFANRFWSKVDKSGDCWEWTSSKHKLGYGRFAVTEGGVTRVEGAHRVSYELTHGAIPEGLHIDHMCHNEGCVNPSHLRAVTPKQNTENRKGPQVNSTTGVQGVFWVPSHSRYRAVVKHFGKAVIVGEYVTLEEAEAAVIAKRNELFTHNDADRMARG